MPDWVSDAVWWQVYPLGFLGALHGPQPQGVAHRLPQLEQWIPYAVELGANGLALGPLFASESHGYDTLDHTRVDPRVGDEADLVSLVDACHATGVRVLLDGVFNHVGYRHPAFQAALREGPDSPTASWFRFRWPPDWQPGQLPEYDVFEGHGGLVELNHDDPGVVQLVVDVMCHWLERGVDGWRLDAAYAVPPEFWARVLPAVRARFPQAYVVGEVIHGDYADLVRRSTLDAVTQYELWKGIWSSLNDGNFYELAHALERHEALLDTFVPMTFVGNHDVTRIATMLDDVRHVPHALAVLFTISGTPSVYYGDEQGYRGRTEDRVGGDDEVRPPFPGAPQDLSAIGWPTYRLHQEVIGLRRRHRWLHGSRVEVIHLANEQLSYRSVPGPQWQGEAGSLVVVLNVADRFAAVPVPAVGQVLAGSARFSRAGTGPAVTLPAHGWAILAGG